jgi:hypothetical protein
MLGLEPWRKILLKCIADLRGRFLMLAVLVGKVNAKEIAPISLVKTTEDEGSTERRR